MNANETITKSEQSLTELLENPEVVNMLSQLLGVAKQQNPDDIDLGIRRLQGDEPSGSQVRREQNETAPMEALTLVYKNKSGEDVTYLNRYVNRQSFGVTNVSRVSLKFSEIQDEDGNVSTRINPTLILENGIVISVFEHHFIIFHNDWKNVVRCSFNKDGHPVMFKEPKRVRESLPTEIVE